MKKLLLFTLLLFSSLVTKAQYDPVELYKQIRTIGIIPGRFIQPGTITIDKIDPATVTQLASGTAGVANTNASNLTQGTLPVGRLPGLVGDLTSSAGTGSLTLNSIISPGTIGSSSSIPIITYDSKGRITGVSSSTFSIGSGTGTTNLALDNTLRNANPSDPANSISNRLGVNQNIVVTKTYLDSLLSANGNASGNFVTRQSSNTNASYTITNASSNRIILTVDPSSTLVSKTINLPASPIANQEVIIEFGGTLASGVVVTNVTITSTQGFIQTSSPNGQVVVGDDVRYIYNNSKWFRH